MNITININNIPAMGNAAALESAENRIKINDVEHITLNGMLEAIGRPDLKAKFAEIKRSYFDAPAVRAAEKAKEEAERKAKRRAKTMKVTEKKALGQDSEGELGDTDTQEDSEFAMPDDGASMDQELSEAVDEPQKHRKIPKKWPIPSPWLLSHDPAVKVVATTEDESCTIYSNGFVVYDDGNRRPVTMWLSDCGDFSYEDKQISTEEAPASKNVNREYLSGQPWFTAILLSGSYRQDSNRSYSSGDRNKDGNDDQEMAADSNHAKEQLEERDTEDEKICEDEKGNPGPVKFDDPQRAYEKKERFSFYMRRLTPYQQDVVLGYYIYGFNYKEMASCLGISKDSVKDRMTLANANLGEDGVKFLIGTPRIEQHAEQYIDTDFHRKLMELEIKQRKDESLKRSYQVLGRKYKK
ncbi:MAG: sigma-70 family RNA polymerase sigma factor [Lachnospiraceae bacterium]|nr:sigma-70 family RNA polymerase sigma factor [Lachnospiraceae bacterium]MBR1857775.1 sigma-70 family RNA polymerase sigma factor [Oribacterium sp.]